jgi:hypothetical protein
MAVVLGTRSDDAADRLAAEVNVLVADGPVDRALMGAFTDGLSAQAAADSGGFALLAREPRPRVLPQCRHVPARDGMRPGDGERPV